MSMPRTHDRTFAGSVFRRATGFFFAIAASFLCQAVVKLDTACEAQSNRPQRHGDTEKIQDSLRLGVSVAHAPCLAARGTTSATGSYVFCGFCDDRRTCFFTMIQPATKAGTTMRREIAHDSTLRVPAVVHRCGDRPAR